MEGQILAETDDVQNVTVFNKSTNKGTITNLDGEFIIDVALNDRLIISALQFQPITVIVDKEVFLNRKLKIQLVEQIHKLDAVLLSRGLSGNIEKDIANVKEVKPIILDMGNMNVSFEYNEDKFLDNEVIHNHLRSIINKNDRKYLPNLGKILDLISKPKKKKPKKIDKTIKIPDLEINLLDFYTHNDISEILNISLNKVDDFISFLNVGSIHKDLFKKENEIMLIDLLIKESVEFLKK